MCFASNESGHREAEAMKILFVLAGLGAGGAERVVALLSGEMIRRGHEIAVASFDSPTDPIYHSFHPQVDFVRMSIPAGGGSFLRGIHANYRRTAMLRGILRQRRPDVVVSFLTKINVLSIVAAAGLDIPVVISERNNPVNQRAHPFWTNAWKIAASRASAIVLQTEAIRSLYPETIQRRAVVIPNPVVLSTTERKPHDGLVLAAVGRLEWQKGFDLLIQAFAAIASDFPDWRLTIWGEGAERSRLQQLADQSGYADRIELAGNSKSQSDWTGNADIFVLSSRYEGFPNVLLEAMSAGLPVLSFRCDFGPEEMIEDGVDGVLVEPGRIDDLSQKLSDLMKNEKLRMMLGTAACKSAVRYEVTQIVSKWEAIVKKEICSNGK